MKPQTFSKNIFFLAFITSFFIPLAALTQPTYTYLVKSNYDSKDPVPLKVMYKGTIIDLSDGIAFLPEIDLIESFELIITAEHPKMSPGPLPHLEKIPGVACDWYNLSWTTQGTKIIWNIEKRSEESLPPRIPNNALIICYPPEFIEKIETKVPQESSTTIHLPTIFLKTNLSTEEKDKRNDALNRSALAHLEVSSYLSPATQLVKQGNKVRLARAQG